MDFGYEDEVLNYLNEVAAENFLQNQQLLDLINAVGSEKRKYTVHQRIDPFIEYDDAEFERRYRLSKPFVDEIYRLIDGPNTLQPMVNFSVFLIFCLQIIQLNDKLVSLDCSIRWIYNTRKNKTVDSSTILCCWLFFGTSC